MSSTIKNRILKISVFLFPLFVSGQPDPFLIKPYLYSVGQNHINVSWELREQNSSPVSLTFSSPDGSVKVVPAVLNENVYTAVLPIPSCGFGSGLSYSVPGMVAPITIDPVSCSDDPHPFQFSLIADPQKNPPITQKMALLTEKQNTSAVVIAGDLVQVGENEQEWIDFFQSMQPLIGHRLMVPVIGNHEYWQDDTAKRWKIYFQTAPKDMHFILDLGKARIFAINSNLETHPELIDPQVKWLEKSLSETPPGIWTFVVMHHPPYSSGNVLKLKPGSLQEIVEKEDDGDDDEAPANPGDIHKALGSIRGREHLALQQYFVPVFEKYKVNFVLCGHKHIFERSLKEGVNYITAGPAGGTIATPVARNRYASRMPSRERTVTNFTIDGSSVRATTLKMNGEVLDDLTVKRK